MMVNRHGLPSGKWWTGLFALSQVAVMALAISNESLWIDEFWTAHFAAMGSFREFYELLLVPNGSQTPLHFLHFYLWGLVMPPGEAALRLANLPLFVAGQLAVFWALRDYPRTFSGLFLIISALHPMVWLYANEARPYILMYAGSQMILSYLLHLHAASGSGRPVETAFLLLFVVGGILLFGASLLGVFWVFAACLHVLVHHLRKSTWRDLLQGVNLLLLGLFLAAVALLTVYYLNSLLKGAGGSRVSTSTPATVLFAAYEMLGMAGIGPSRLELRSLGLAALVPFAFGLLAAGSVVLVVLALGLNAARTKLGSRELMLLGALGLLPVAIVIYSGFAMQWRVLGRHLIAALPILNLIFALGLVKLFEVDVRRNRSIRPVIAVAFLLALLISSLSLRFSDRHKKDDYRSAAAVAQQNIAQGKRVWWAADYVGANYYQLPGEFDYMGEMTGMHKPHVCVDQTGIQPIANVSLECLRTLSSPDLVILSKPESFDRTGGVAGYLKAEGFVITQEWPAFTIWRRRAQSEQSK